MKLYPRPVVFAAGFFSPRKSYRSSRLEVPEGEWFKTSLHLGNTANILPPGRARQRLGIKGNDRRDGLKLSMIRMPNAAEIS